MLKESVSFLPGCRKIGQMQVAKHQTWKCQHSKPAKGLHQVHTPKPEGCVECHDCTNAPQEPCGVQHPCKQHKRHRPGVSARSNMRDSRMSRNAPKLQLQAQVGCQSGTAVRRKSETGGLVSVCYRPSAVLNIPCRG